MILKSNFKKYMIALDSTYSINVNLKAYVKNLVTGKQKMFFHEFFYNENFGLIEYQILYKKNKFDIDVTRNKDLFLKKYLVNYTINKKYYNVSNN